MPEQLFEIGRRTFETQSSKASSASSHPDLVERYSSLYQYPYGSRQDRERSGHDVTTLIRAARRTAAPRSDTVTPLGRGTQRHGSDNRRWRPRDRPPSGEERFGQIPGFSVEIRHGFRRSSAGKASIMGTRARGLPGEGGRHTPLVQVPADLHNTPGRDGGDESGRDRHPFERHDVSDQGAPDGGHSEDDHEDMRRPEDPADPMAPIHPDE